MPCLLAPRYPISVAVWISRRQEVISVRGSAPVNSRDVRRYCHPGAANQLNWLYNCVHKETLGRLGPCWWILRVF